MQLAAIFSIVGFLLLIIGGAMLLPMGVSFFYGEQWPAFLAGAAVTVLLGWVLYFVFRGRSPAQLRHREALAVVGLSWALAIVMSSLPLHLSGEFASYSDALFEACSGMTATGATVMSNVEAAGRGVLLWRSLTHWLGGMGFIVLSLAVLPLLSLGGMQLYKAELPSPSPDRLRPHIKDIVKLLWRIYLFLTLLAWLGFCLGGMSVFDALNHAMSSLSSGGFSTKNGSIGAYNSPLLEWMCIVFMTAAGVNFSLYFWLLRRRSVWLNEELRYYLGLILLCSAGVWVLLSAGGDMAWPEALRRSFFQVSALISTTGFSSADYGQWPASVHFLLIAAMLAGACAGSTGGGPKIIRWLIFFKFVFSELKQVMHPRSINSININRQPLDRSVITAVSGFLGLYFCCFFLIALALVLTGMNLETSFSASLACLGNIGPGLGELGPAHTYAALPAAAKWILSLAMLLGRLEIFPVLVLFMPSFWRQ
ncbi:MAG: TrkH family potassium uptake protein [Desulfarculales bacterium]|jgi:trk system potassium uptake protein TrkH|nr:TrkH family potassium uptake protein [Desulfarculales bacterium]